MIGGGHVPHGQFVARFEKAVECFSEDARADELPKYVARFHRVETDMFATEKTSIELPSWV